MNKLTDYEEILQTIYNHAALLIETDLVDGLTPTQVVANLANELVLLEQAGDLDNYKKEYIDPYMDNEQINEVMAEVQVQLDKKKGSLH